jgi:hypothetical protein
MISIRLRSSLALVVAAACGCLIGAPTQAQHIINNTGINNPAETITFSEHSFATGTPITNQFSDLGVTFGPALYYDVQPVFFPTDFLANFDGNGNSSNPDAILFNNVQTAAAFAVETNPGTTTFTALLNGVPVDTFTAATTLSFLPDTSQDSNFYGFANESFNEIDVNPSNTFFQIDNLQLGSIGSSGTPEPGSIALLGGLSLAGAAVLRRRRRGQG